jgi:hypothetical protein
MGPKVLAAKQQKMSCDGDFSWRSAVGPVYDDKRWSTKLCETSRQLFVSVGYRLPLKYHYPTAVDDGVDEILYLCMYAEMLGIGSKMMQPVGSRSEDTYLSLSIKSERLPEKRWKEIRRFHVNYKS